MTLLKVAGRERFLKNTTSKGLSRMVCGRMPVSNVEGSLAACDFRRDEFHYVWL